MHALGLFGVTGVHGRGVFAQGVVHQGDQEFTGQSGSDVCHSRTGDSALLVQSAVTDGIGGCDDVVAEVAARSLDS